jgi:hypothetical protein
VEKSFPEEATYDPKIKRAASRWARRRGREKDRI